MKISSENKPYLFFIAALLLAFPAFLTNLGLSPVIDDEAIRALVSFEMVQTGDYITPSIGGDVYLKKPPLYNWIIATSYELFDSYDEIPVRIPMIVSLFLYTLIIFYYFKKEAGPEMGIINALLFLTSGRIIIYESLHGLIDITFSMLTFVLFMLIYRCFNQGRLLKLFMFAYLVTAVAFLLKGLPSLVFLGISLLVLFIWQKKFKLLFNWRHFAGMAVFVVIVGAYYITYFMQNNVSPSDMLDVLVGETTRRTALRFGIWRTIFHLFSFPFEMIYHFLPWSLLLIVLLRKGIVRQIKSNPFISYLWLIFFFNILVYWSSPEVYARYILMLVPLFFGVCTSIYFKYRENKPVQNRIIEIIFGVILSLTVVIPAIPLFIDVRKYVPDIYLISALLFVVIVPIIVFYWKQARFRLYWLAIALLVLRIGFDLVVLPVRHTDSKEAQKRELAGKIVKYAEGKDLYFWWNPKVPATGYYGRQITSYRFNYYLTINRGEVIPITSKKLKDAYMISVKWEIKDEDVDVIREMKPPGHSSPIVIFQFK